MYTIEKHLPSCLKNIETAENQCRPSSLHQVSDHQQESTELSSLSPLDDDQDDSSEVSIATDDGEGAATGSEEEDVIELEDEANSVCISDNESEVGDCYEMTTSEGDSVTMETRLTTPRASLTTLPAPGTSSKPKSVSFATKVRATYSLCISFMRRLRQRS